MDRRGFVKALGIGLLAGCTEQTESPPGTDSRPNPTQAAAETPTPTPTPNRTVHELGEEFVVGGGGQKIRYRVGSPGFGSRVGGEYVGETADGVFMVVPMELVNVGDETFHVSSNLYTLIDEEEREYAPDSAAMTVVDEAISFAEQLDPGVPKVGVIIFDIPPKSGVSFKLRIDPAGLFSTSDSHYVKLGST